jgi:signal transduction histidine kinase
MDADVIGSAARQGQTVLVNDAEADPRYENWLGGGAATRSEMGLPIRAATDVIGVLDVQSQRRDAFGVNDVLVMETLADQIAVALENARLYEAGRVARDELRDLTAYLQDAREEERTRIAREVHDEFGQLLTALKMDLSWLAKRLPSDEPQLEEKADAMSDMIDRSFEVVRRVSSELRPGILDDLGVAAAIEWQAELYAERSGIAFRLDLDEAAETLDRESSTALFRILQEALTNVGRHAEAEEVRIDLRVGPDDVTLVVADDGRGITPDEISGQESLGLVGMRERARALGGEVTIEGVPGEGSRVTASIPRQRKNPDKGTGSRALKS